ncbi:hypothetical protein BXZ70DRAFT_51209 [Cristinia sonorae]|uniref:Uncharacterized protein n=1 Tax=Cristinia sonorae TaxID=1940300 RepID=A0A8K0XR48_9AGAR|nr:hypothetical protein BXZ70DRAFT_51209 [Cristinia sonorae]
MSSSTSPTASDIHEPLCSSSVDTIRGLPSELTLAISMSDGGSRPETPPHISESSRPPSPHSSWPSPSSPSGDSVSSFPSVSSSFLFSSTANTPPHVDLDLATHHTNTYSDDADPHELIIPSLILPSPLKRPTHHGKSLGDVKLLVLSRSSQSAEEVLRILSDEECEDYVDVGRWEDLEVGTVNYDSSPHERPKVLRVSTDWFEHRDAHGLEKYEATRNIELVHLPEYSTDTSPAEVVRAALQVVHAPFHILHSLLNPESAPNNLLASMLSSPTTPLYTALIFPLDEAPSHYDEALIKGLCPHIPLIVLPPHVQSTSMLRNRRLPHTSSIHAESPLDLRTALLRSTETLLTLRVEAADRFLRWREVERSVENALNTGPESPNVERVLRDWRLHADPASHPGFKSLTSVRWDKEKWEAEWEGSLSADVSLALRQRRSQSRTHPLSEHSTSSGPSRHTSLDEKSFVRDRPANGVPALSLDPLHIPSLVAFSYHSLLAPLRARLANIFTPAFSSSAHPAKSLGMSVGILFGAFCAGLGFGFVIAKFRT